MKLYESGRVSRWLAVQLRDLGDASAAQLVVAERVSDSLPDLWAPSRTRGYHVMIVM